MTVNLSYNDRHKPRIPRSSASLKAFKSSKSLKSSSIACACALMFSPFCTPKKFFCCCFQKKTVANRTDQLPKSKSKKKKKRFLRRSQGEGSRKPMANRTDQAIQRARSRAKAFTPRGMTQLSNLTLARLRAFKTRLVVLPLVPPLTRWP